MNPSLAPALDQSRPFEHVEMAGYGRKRDAKRPGQSGYAPFAAPGKALHDAAAGRVGESRKHIRHLLSIVNHGVKYNLRSSPVKRIVNDAVKYLRERTIGSQPGAAPPNPKPSRRAGLTKAAASRLFRFAQDKAHSKFEICRPALREPLSGGRREPHLRRGEAIPRSR